ncbi:MAG TPA: flippase-like domain-containing protein [Acholeplasmataceae bacterium]|jgi:uncharacterized protein (TIRG00374 family)|nr:flippase-like domain-containing protein [Acholeplasmataceae bacterium]
METQIKKKNQKLKTILQMAIVGVIFIALIFAVSQLGDLSDLRDKFLNVNVKYLIIVIILTITYLVFMILPHFFIAIFHKTKMDKTRLFLNASNEYFFNGITPSQSGSQPFQTFVYLKHGVSGDDATSILTTTYVNYQLIANILSTVALIVLWIFHSEVLKDKLVIVILGYILNLAVLVLIFFLTFSKKFPKLVQNFLYLLAKIKPFRKILTKAADNTPKVVRSFQKSSSELYKKKRFLIFTSLLRVIALVAYYAVPYFVAKALNMNVSNSDFIFMLSITLVATTLMAWFPLPGSSGGVETIFVVLLTAMATINQVDAVNIMFVTRLFTFYFAMLWGLLAYFILKIMDIIKDKRLKRYQERIKGIESLKIGIVCDNYHNNAEAQLMYKQLSENQQNPIIITHTIHSNNPSDTVYLKMTKCKLLRYFQNNNIFRLSRNRKEISKHNFDILHFINAMSHTRLLSDLKKHEPIPIIFTENNIVNQLHTYRKFKRDNLSYRLEKMLITSDVVLPESLDNSESFENHSFKLTYNVDPTLITHDDFNQLKCDKLIDVSSKGFKHKYLLVFPNYQVERFVDFYFGIKDNLDDYKDSLFIIVGNLKLPSGLKNSLEKNDFIDNVLIINDIDNAKSYFKKIDAFIQEEYSARTSTFYLTALANHTKVLVPKSISKPNAFNSASNIYEYTYADDFNAQIKKATESPYHKENIIENYFNTPIGIRLTSLYFNVVKDIRKD